MLENTVSVNLFNESHFLYIYSLVTAALPDKVGWNKEERACADGIPTVHIHFVDVGMGIDIMKCFRSVAKAGTSLSGVMNVGRSVRTTRGLACTMVRSSIF